jgi:hypothetical protein
MLMNLSGPHQKQTFKVEVCRNFSVTKADWLFLFGAGDFFEGSRATEGATCFPFNQKGIIRSKNRRNLYPNV